MYDEGDEHGDSTKRLLSLEKARAINNEEMRRIKIGWDAEGRLLGFLLFNLFLC